MKMIKLIYIRPTPFKDGILKNSWWYWFKSCHLESNTWLVKGLEVCNAQDLRSQACNSLYQNLSILYIQHKYNENHIWNSNETNI